MKVLKCKSQINNQTEVMIVSKVLIILSIIDIKLKIFYTSNVEENFSWIY
jgi:hypothetical protein